MTSERIVATPRGDARLVVRRARHPIATLVLTHGAGGGIDTDDLQALAVRTEALLDESRSLSAEVKDFRLGLEIAVIQAFADKIVGMLKVRDPLSERVHLSKPELLAQSIGGIVSEMIRRAAGRRPQTKPVAGA